MTILLPCLALITGSLHIRADYQGIRSQIYLFKPLTTTLILLLAVQVTFPASLFYQYFIIAGLLFSLLGDIFLMLPTDRFIPGLASFLVAHLCYIAAFASNLFQPPALWSSLPFLLYGAFIFYLLSPHLGKMWQPVLVYILTILLMVWMAFEQWQQIGHLGTLLAFLGAVLFAISDSALALNRFRRPFHSAQATVLSSYYVAQCLIALSIQR